MYKRVINLCKKWQQVVQRLLFVMFRVSWALYPSGSMALKAGPGLFTAKCFVSKSTENHRKHTERGCCQLDYSSFKFSSQVLGKKQRSCYHLLLILYILLFHEMLLMLQGKFSRSLADLDYTGSQRSPCEAVGERNLITAEISLGVFWGPHCHALYLTALCHFSQLLSIFYWPSISVCRDNVQTCMPPPASPGCVSQLSAELLPWVIRIQDAHMAATENT